MMPLSHPSLATHPRPLLRICLIQSRPHLPPPLALASLTESLLLVVVGGAAFIAQRFTPPLLSFIIVPFICIVLLVLLTPYALQCVGGDLLSSEDACSNKIKSKSVVSLL